MRAACCARAARLRGPRRKLWMAMTAVSMLVILAAAAGVAAELLGAEPTIAFYLGSLASVGLLVSATLLRQCAPWRMRPSTGCRRD